MTEQPKVTTIQELIDEAAACAKEKGWDDDYRPITEDLLLVHSEISEACEDLRSGRASDELYYEDKVIAGDGKSEWELLAKPCGVPTELADVMIRVAHMAKRHGIDLVAAINLKLAYNRTRSHRHGNKKF